MLKIVLGVFIILHGLVHILYFGQSRRLFELRPGMVWPDGSWAFSNLIGERGTRWLASISFILATLGFVAGGIGIILGWVWWRPIVAVSAIFSSTITTLLWDGKIKKLDDQGFIGLIINSFILIALLISL